MERTVVVCIKFKVEVYRLLDQERVALVSWRYIWYIQEG
jgi:hypothetical protein